MSVIEAPVIDRVTTEFVQEPGDHEKMAHIVWPASGLTEAYIMGSPVAALCGKVWTPTRDPEQFPVCQRCLEVYEGETPGRPWKGRRT